MRNKISKTACKPAAFLCGCAAFFVLALSSSVCSAQSLPGKVRGDKIEGVWDSQVTIVDCTNGTVLASFRGLGIFVRGGSNIQTNNLPPGPGPTALGQWEKLGGGHYTVSSRFFAFANGVFTGVQRVTRDIQLAPDGDTFTSVVATEFYDPNGNLVGTGCGTEAATRVE
jgi:hypothetical protein